MHDCSACIRSCSFSKSDDMVILPDEAAAMLSAARCSCLQFLRCVWRILRLSHKCSCSEARPPASRSTFSATSAIEINDRVCAHMLSHDAADILSCPSGPGTTAGWFAHNGFQTCYLCVWCVCVCARMCVGMYLPEPAALEQSPTMRGHARTHARSRIHKHICTCI